MANDLITDDIVVTRLFPASAERVWKAWTTEEDVKRWWGPDHFTAPHARMDVRKGGRSLVCMRSPDGQDMWMSWDYSKVVPNERLDYVQNLADETGNRLDPGAIGMPPDFPRDVATVVTLVPENGGTRMTISERTTTSELMLKMSKTGLEQSIDKMGTLLS